MVEAIVEPDAASASRQEDIARGELGETAESTQQSLSELRLLIANEVCLDCPTDDKFLLKFLRAAKHRVQEAFERIQKYFSARQRWPELFDDLSPSTVNYETVVAQNRLVMVSKKSDPEGRTVALIKMGSWNSGICPLTEFMRACIVLAEWCLLNEEAQLHGIVGVIDLKGLQLSHMVHYTPSVVRMAAHISQVHLIGNNLEKMHDILPADVIPNEFGGTLENFDCVSQEEDLSSSTGYFESMCRFGYKNQ
ncbi:alpha-tocopherol transfer protein-like isoform X2 [Haemaphysalis longicornis]